MDSEVKDGENKTLRFTEQMGKEFTDGKSKKTYRHTVKVSRTPTGTKLA